MWRASHQWDQPWVTSDEYTTKVNRSLLLKRIRSFCLDTMTIGRHQLGALNVSMSEQRRWSSFVERQSSNDHMRICLYVQGKLKNDAHIDTSISSDGQLPCRVTTREEEEKEEEDDDDEEEEEEREKEKGATTWIDHCRWLIFSRHLTLHITNILCFSSSSSSYILLIIQFVFQSPHVFFRFQSNLKRSSVVGRNRSAERTEERQFIVDLIEFLIASCSPTNVNDKIDHYYKHPKLKTSSKQALRALFHRWQQQQHRAAIQQVAHRHRRQWFHQWKNLHRLAWRNSFHNNNNNNKHPPKLNPRVGRRKTWTTWAN